MRKAGKILEDKGDNRIRGTYLKKGDDDDKDEDKREFVNPEDEECDKWKHCA